MNVVARQAGLFSSQFCIPQAIFDALLEECGAARSGAWRIESDICELARDGAVNGRGKCWIAGPAKALLNFQNDIGLAIARAFAGEEHELLPTRAAYIYYEAGDFSFLHHDASTSHITVVAGLTDGLLPLMLYRNFLRLPEVISIDLTPLLFRRIRTTQAHLPIYSAREECRLHYQFRSSTPWPLRDDEFRTLTPNSALKGLFALPAIHSSNHRTAGFAPEG